MENLNILSLVISTIIPVAFGMLWYSKPLFQKAWMESCGMTDEKAKDANMPKMMGISLIMSLLISFFMLGFCNGLGQEGEFDTFKHGFTHGIIVGIFLIIPVFVTSGLFEMKSWKNMLINGFYWVISLALMGGVLDAMNHFPNV